MAAIDRPAWRNPWILFLALVILAIAIYFLLQGNSCQFKSYTTLDRIQDPWANVTAGESGFLVFAMEGARLSNADTFHYYWNVRPTIMVDSPIKHEGVCEVLAESNALRCDSLSFAGILEYDNNFQYELDVVLERSGCEPVRILSQEGILDHQFFGHEIVIFESLTYP